MIKLSDELGRDEVIKLYVALEGGGVTGKSEYITGLHAKSASLWGGMRIIVG